MMRRVVWVLFALLLCLSGEVTAEAQSTDDAVARKLFEAGKVAYDAGDYEDALRFFEQAHDRSARPGLLFNIGQAADRLREDAHALTAYRAYLVQVPDATNRSEVESRIRAMERAQRVVSPSAPERRVAPTPEATARAGSSTVVEPASTESTQPARDVDEAGVTSRWWFWTAIGAVVIGGVVAAVALSPTDAQEPMLVQGDVEGVVTTLQAGR